MSNDIRIGVVGVGQIGNLHVGAYAKIDGANVVAAADINEAELKRVAQQHNIPHTYTDFRELVNRDDIDAVDVCLHNNFHMPVTVAALQAGKHVYCEKPMAGSYADALKMYETARTCGRKLSIQLATLHYAETKFAKNLITGGRLGRVYHARSTGFRRRGRPYVDGYGTEFFVKKETAGGGALFDMGVYHISQILYLLGLPTVERISGKVYQELDMDPERRAKGGYSVEELGMGFVKFEGGVTLDIIESWAINLDKFESSYVVGSKGGIRLSPLTFHTHTDGVPTDTTFNVGGGGNPYDEPQRHWVRALRGTAELLPTAETALQTMLVSEGIYLSDGLGREVSAGEVAELSKSTAIDPAA